MQYFWCSKETIPEGVGFSHYDLTHIFWLVLFAAAAVVCCLHYRRLSAKGRKIWQLVLSALLVADELFKHIGLVCTDAWAVDYLPLHLCSINLFLIIWHTLRPNKILGNFLYTVCIPGAAAALLFPNWTNLPLLNFMHIHSSSVHVLLALYPIVLTICGDISVDHKMLPKCMLVLAGLAIPTFLINSLLDTNFFFLSYAEPGNPLYWFEVNWGSHLLGFPVLIGAILLVMHGPIYLFKRCHKTKTANAA